MNQPNPKHAGAAIIEAAENQIEANDPPKVKHTLTRLMSMDISRSEALKYIACALSVEIFGILKNQEEFNPQRYDDNLDNLPEMPWEDESVIKLKKHMVSLSSFEQPQFIVAQL